MMTEQFKNKAISLGSLQNVYETLTMQMCLTSWKAPLFHAEGAPLSRAIAVGGNTPARLAIVLKGRPLMQYYHQLQYCTMYNTVLVAVNTELLRHRRA